MNFLRIKTAIDVDTLQQKQVTVFGAGGSADFITNLARCGIQRFTLIDPDRIDATNMARQGHSATEVGRYKVDAVRDKILEINPDAIVDTLTEDLTQCPEEQAVAAVAGTDLIVAATDSFRCQSLVNRLALTLNIPAVAVGVYDYGLGAEVAWIDPVRQAPCFRCLFARRYEQQGIAACLHGGGGEIGVYSAGVDIFSVRFPDAIAGQLVIGLLTQGAPNRYGRLIEQLGDRQFIQVGMSPEFELNGRDIIREKLAIPADNPAYFAWSSIALSDPDQGQLRCRDCEELRGHRFVEENGVWRRETA